MGISSLFLGLGIVYSWRLICVIASFAFVAGFSIGLGPIPFLIISEFVDAEGVSAGQSFGLVTNWVATFCVVRSLASGLTIGLLFPHTQRLVGWLCIHDVYRDFSILLCHGQYFYTRDKRPGSR
jgi:hypothetical protein